MQGEVEWWEVQPQERTWTGLPHGSGSDGLGAQRLSLEQLHDWEALGYGMFLHFGMSTFEGRERSLGDRPSLDYHPDSLNVNQWISVAADAGMRYAVLTVKHGSGHCLWPSDFTDYNVTTSGNSTDVVDKFVSACQQYKLMAGIYYCSVDTHNSFGSLGPETALGSIRPFSTARYRAFQANQIEELLSRYGPIGEVYIDVPGMLGPDGRNEQYAQISELSPNSVVLMNSVYGDGNTIDTNFAWPTDALVMERTLPSSRNGYRAWHTLDLNGAGAQRYYVPGEVSETIGQEWFHVPGDMPRSPSELLGMRLVTCARGSNLLLNVPPDRHGVIPRESVDALQRLARDYERAEKPGAAMLEDKV